jgi:hypothetical protein
VRAQRQLGRRARQVRACDLGAVRVEHGVLGSAREEHAGMRHEVLVECVGLRDERDRGVAAPADATAALPRRDLAARVADQDADIETADVDAELERRRRDHARELAVEQPTLDLAALRGQEAGAVAADARRERGLRFEHPVVQQLGDDARLRERDRAQSARQRAAEQLRRDGVG